MAVRIRIILIRVAAVAVFTVITFGTVAYVRGDFDLPFIKRPEPEIVIDITPETTLITEKPAEPSSVLINLNHNSSPTSINNSNSRAQVILPKMTAEQMSQGFYITDGIYKKFDQNDIDNIINQYSAVQLDLYEKALKGAKDPAAVAVPEVAIPAQYEYILTQIDIQDIKLPSALTVLKNDVYEYAVQPKMGFIFIMDGEKTALTCSNGAMFIPDFNGYNFISKRSSNGLPVFEAGGKYFNYIESEGTFNEVAYDEKKDNVGVPFNYPGYYGAAIDSGITRISSGNSWGYSEIVSKKPIISPTYNFAYNFSDGVGQAVVDEGPKGLRLYFYSTAGRILSYAYYMPSVLTEEHLGFCYFDHGLTRVLKRMFNIRPAIVGEEQLLVDKNGVIFTTPKDYTVKTYSNGIILLEKEGKFGYMNWRGEWIAQPIYTYARPFFEGLAVVGFADGKKAVIDTEGNMLTQFEFDYISDCSGGAVALYNNTGGWSVLNKVRRDFPVTLPDIRRY